MSYHLTQQGSEVVLQPERASRVLSALFKRFHGRTVDVASHLGVSTSTVKRWVALLEASGHFTRDDIDLARKAARG
jgi:DNA-binding IclR family transcriptional regulator